MKKAASVWTFFIALGMIMIMAATISACGLQKEPEGGASPQDTHTAAPSPPSDALAPRNFEVDYTKIEGTNPEERLSSLVSLINAKGEGYAKVFSYIQPIEISGSDEKGVVYMHVLMVYGDIGQTEQEMNDYMNGVFLILKQLVNDTAKFVSDSDKGAAIQIQVSYPDGSQQGYSVSPDVFSALREAPSEAWMQHTRVQDLSLIFTPQIEEMRNQINQLSAALEVAMDKGYLTEDEVKKIMEELSTFPKSKTAP